MRRIGAQRDTMTYFGSTKSSHFSSILPPTNLLERTPSEIVASQSDSM